MRILSCQNQGTHYFLSLYLILKTDNHHNNHIFICVILSRIENEVRDDHND